MTNYQAGDLVLVDFPLTTSGPSKPRPALVLLDTGDADVMLARVTTQPRSTPYDVPIADWQAAGLLAPSIVRVHKVATLAKARVQRVLGTLNANDRQEVGRILQQIAPAADEGAATQLADRDCRGSRVFRITAKLSPSRTEAKLRSTSTLASRADGLRSVGGHEAWQRWPPLGGA